MQYQSPDSLTTLVGNRLLAPSWKGSLEIPCCINGELQDVKMGESIVFAAEENGKIITARGLQYFVRTAIYGTPAVIMDNHNHALYFWYEAFSQGLISSNATLLHIDEHSDLWENEYKIDQNKIRDLSYIYEFVRDKTNVGNYIIPAKNAGLIDEVIRIEGEFDLKREEHRIIDANTIFNLDLDIFSPELSDIPFNLLAGVIRGFAKEASFITIATSPFFIDQDRAIERLHTLFSD